MPQRNELTDLDLGEWSICIDPANEDSTIEIVKSKSGLGPVLKETDMSEHNEELDNEEADIEQFAEEVLSAFEECETDEDRADFIVGLAAENVDMEEAVEVAKSFIEDLAENTVSKEKYEEVVKTLRQSGELIEKMRSTGNAALDDGGLVAEIRKANGADLSPEAAERIAKIEKAQAAADRKEAIAKAKTFGFGKAEDVADLSSRIRKALGDKDADLYESQIKQAGAILKASPMLKPVGEDAGNADSTSPIAKAKASVADIKKANPGFTDAQAMTKYWADNPEEYAAHQAARNAA